MIKDTISALGCLLNRINLKQEPSMYDITVLDNAIKEIKELRNTNALYEAELYKKNMVKNENT